MKISQTIFVCEGYHDRSFLAGWLLRIGCVDLSQTLGRRVKDPWGKPVVLGHYGYNDVKGRFLRIAPAGGESQCFAVADGLLSGRSTQPIRDLFLVVDADASAATREEQFKGLVQRHEGTLTHPRLAVLSPHTQLHLLVLETQTDPEGSGPRLQSLERVICAAIVDAYPERAAIVERWLAEVAQPNDPTSEAKSHAWSHMAGWYPKLGCDAFHSQIWLDPIIEARLIEILSRNGSWQAVWSAISGDTGP